MPKQVWVCETCQARYESEERALKCEALHPDPRTFEITGGGFRSMNGAYGTEYTTRARVPSSLTVKFSDARGDFGVYEFRRYGPKGL